MTEYEDYDARRARKEELASRVSAALGEYRFIDDAGETHEFSLQPDVAACLVTRMFDRMFPKGFPKDVAMTDLSVMWAALEEMKAKGQFHGNSKEAAKFLMRKREGEEEEEEAEAENSLQV